VPVDKTYLRGGLLRLAEGLEGGEKLRVLFVGQAHLHRGGVLARLLGGARAG